MGKCFAILLTLVLVTMQTVTMAHATAYGDEEHDHNGVECLISKAGSPHDDDWDVPPEVILVFLPRMEMAIQSFALKALLVPTVTVLPPGRAPPLA